MIDWLLFRTGWRRRSALMLNTAGCPHWLIRWRCGVIIWGDVLGRGSPGLLDSSGISAEKIQAAIDRLREVQR